MPSKNFIDYAVTLLYKDRADHAFSFFIFAFIVFILSAVLFVSSSIQSDLTNLTRSKPEVVVDALRAGKRDLIHDVASVEGAVEGEYYFAQKRVWFHIVGDENLDENEMIVGEGVKKEMAELYYEDVFNFLTEEKMIPIKINKTAPHETGIVSNDVIYMNPDTAREVLSLKEGEYTRLYVEVPNVNEISEVALKIQNVYPNTEVTSIEDGVAKIRHLYYYKGGIFMVLYVVAMVSFFILLKNQISLAYGEKKKEIAILRSIGFSVRNIIALKFIQNIVVSFSAYLLGVAGAYLYVFLFGAPFLRDIFLGSEVANFTDFTPIIDFNMLFLIFVFSVIPFLAFVIIPSWRIAVSDMSEAVK